MDPSKHAYYPPSMPSHQPPHYPQPPPPPYYPQHPNAVMPPMMPQPHPHLPSDDFKVVVRGHVNRDAREFAIDITSNGHILLHMNPRWTEGHTVFNSQGVNGWGAEVRRLFHSLEKGSDFVITIQSSRGYFHINVNGEKFEFQQRIPAGPAREVRISKVHHHDVNITGVEVAPF